MDRFRPSPVRSKLTSATWGVDAVKPRDIVFHRRLDKSGTRWKDYTIPMPENTGTAKGVAVADINKDGELDIVFSCEQAEGNKEGVMWMTPKYTLTDPEWEATTISGPEGVKFDRIELLDVDRDGDLDVFTCEERDNLGVFWYENPAR